MNCNRKIVAEKRVEIPKAYYFGSTVRKTGGML
jgi:hypothetical protein